MSRPPFLHFPAGFPGSPDAYVLRVGKWTVPPMQPESEGGVPASHTVAISHGQLMTFNSDREVKLKVSGAISRHWTKTEVNESGDAASCAKKVTHITGEDVDLNYAWDLEFDVAKRHSLPLATKAVGAIGNSIGSVAPAPAKTELTRIDTISSAQICGSTGCTSGELPNEDNTSTQEFSAILDCGGFESVAKLGTQYRYFFEFGGFVFCSPREAVYFILWAGEYRASTWVSAAGISAEDLPEGMTMGPILEAGSIRGVPISARVISYVNDLSFSTSSGAPGNCPTPSFSSSITEGEEEGGMTVVQISDSKGSSPGASGHWIGDDGGMEIGSEDGIGEGGGDPIGLETGSLTTGSLEIGSLDGSGGLSIGSLDGSGGLETGGL